MNDDFIKVLRQEEFDRSEFKFGRKMLEAKRKANTNVKTLIKEHPFIPKNSLKTSIKTQADVNIFKFTKYLIFYHRKH